MLAAVSAGNVTECSFARNASANSCTNINQIFDAGQAEGAQDAEGTR